MNPFLGKRCITPVYSYHDVRLCENSSDYAWNIGRQTVPIPAPEFQTGMFLDGRLESPKICVCGAIDPSEFEAVVWGGFDDYGHVGPVIPTEHPSCGQGLNRPNEFLQTVIDGSHLQVSGKRLTIDVQAEDDPACGVCIGWWINIIWRPKNASPP